MTTYSAQDRLAAIQKAGFQDPLTALGISLAEFGVNREVTAQAQSDNYFQPGQNPDYPQGGREQSYGPWQIHLPAHPDVTQACAMDLTCSTAAAYKISNGGTNYNPWSTYTNGAYKTALADISASITALATPTSSPSDGGSSLDAGPSSGASAGAAPAAVSCGLDALSILEAGNRLKRGESPAQIAAEFTKELGRPITVECLQADAFSVASTIGSSRLPGEEGIKAAATGLTKFSDLLKSENLWRIGFVIVGAFAVYAGGRMYLTNSEPSTPTLAPEAVK